MSSTDRLFLDANVLFSAAYRAGAGVGALWRIDGVVLLSSTYAAEEARRNLEDKDRIQRLEELMDRVEISDLRSSPQDCGIILPPRVQKGGRSVETRQIVSRNPNVLNGELVFAGTRVPVKNLVDYLAAGDPLEEFLEGFPGVSREQAVAYLEMAREAAEEYSRESAAG